MSQVTLMGMVLSSTPIGEYDKRVVILTKERGKISAFARGARRPGSALGGMILPFTFGEFTAYEGRTSYTLVSASVSNYFAELRTDVEGAYYGFYFMEIADYYCREGTDGTQMLKLLYQTFRALTKESIDNRLIRRIYELKTLCINGQAPHVFGCVKCGEKERAGVFSVRKGGMVCDACRKDVTDGVILDTSTQHALQFIVGARVEQLYTFKVSEHVMRELDLVIQNYMEMYVEKRFKSLEILEMMT